MTTGSSKKTNSSSRSSSRSSSAKKAAETRRRNAERQEKRESMIREISIWITAAIALILFLSNFGICGVVGNALRYVMLGLFGSMGYVFPVMPVIISILFSYGKSHEEKTGLKIASSVGIYLVLDILFDLFVNGNDSMENVVNYFISGTAGEVCGGFVGGVFGRVLHSLFGITGAFIVAIVLLVVCIVLLTEKSITSMIRGHGRDFEKDDHPDEAGENYQAAGRKKGASSNRTSSGHGMIREREKTVGVDFKTTSLGVGDASSGDDQNVHEIKSTGSNINIEGLDDIPVYMSENEPDNVRDVSSEKSSSGKRKKSTEESKSPSQNKNMEPPVYNFQEGADPVFTPDESEPISDAAAAVMKRPVYGKYDPMKESEKEAVTSVEKKPKSEGKILIPAEKKKPKKPYKKPPLSLLENGRQSGNSVTKAELRANAEKLKNVLENFGVNVEINNISRGPSVTRYELQPEIGTKVSRITGLADDIKLNMAASDIRIEAPIPGKAAIGIEIPNEGRDSVCLKDLLMSKELKENKSSLAFPVGKDIAGRVVVGDIAKMPHMLIAGTTGSGKSVFTNSIIMSILYRTTPEEVQLIVIDPKVVEFQVYNKIPHIRFPVVTDPKKAAALLNWAVAEMTTRYRRFAAVGAKDILSYNRKIENGEITDEENPEKMPKILIVIDELADLMMVAAKEVEEAICRLAQLARAAGIHMVISTQRPSVDVITGLIKANIPSRVALTVASGADSRTIIDQNGAEKLLGNGDMLFYPSGYTKPVRVQGAYVTEKEIQRTVDYLVGNNSEVEYDEEIEKKLSADSDSHNGPANERDPYFADAGRLCIERQKGSTSMLQRQFRLGFNRAARIMEQLYDAGVVGQEEQNKPRKVIMTMEEFESYLSTTDQ